MTSVQKYDVQYSTQYAPGTTVVVSQPVGMGRPVLREWSSDVFDCMSDMKICLCGWCCTLCLACQVSQDMGESCLVPCCVPGSITVLRAKFRAQQGISGTVLQDCCCSEFCGACTLCQLKREIEACKANGTLNNMN